MVETDRREIFALVLAHGMVASGKLNDSGLSFDAEREHIVTEAVTLADALAAELDRTAAPAPKTA